jgi:site-specific recombinase XerD
MSEIFSPSRDITINEAIDEYLDQKKATGALSDSSIHNRKYELIRFDKFCYSHKISKPEDIHKKLVTSYLKSLKISKSSKLSIIYVLVGFMDYLVDEGLILENIASIMDKPKTYAPKADFLTFDELERLFRSEAENSPPKVIDRNLLLFSLFTDICLRVSEVINLKLIDVRIDLKEVWVTRKRNKVDKIPLNDYLVNKFLNWYEIRREYKKCDELPWVFLSSHGQQLKPRQVHYIVSKGLERAGILKRKQGPHLLRHSGASLKAQSGENIIMIQYLLGHENLNTTRRYLHFNWDDLKDMVQRSRSIGKKENIED